MYFHTNHQQDAHESLLQLLDILHSHTKIDLFPGLAFPQETITFSSMIRNTFYGITISMHTCSACKWVTTTSSKQWKEVFKRKLLREKFGCFLLNSLNRWPPLGQAQCLLNVSIRCFICKITYNIVSKLQKLFNSISVIFTSSNRYQL